MIRRRSFAKSMVRMVLAAAAVSAGIRFSPAKTADLTSAELSVFSFNLRYASAKPPNSWPERRPVMRALWDQYQPDLVGTQEGVYPQLRDLASDIPHYGWIGTGRDGGSRGEFMAIFYKRSRLEPLEFDHFWLSDTPEVVGSSTWGNTNRRMVTWVRFKDLKTSQEFYFWNTHFDHANQTAREKAAELVQKRLAKLNPTLPLILAGDFNAVAKRNRVYTSLVEEAGLMDTWYAAKERRNDDLNSFNNFAPAVRNGERIDWVLSRGNISVRATEIITFQLNGQNPSDHYPLAVWLTLH